MNDKRIKVALKILHDIPGTTLLKDTRMLGYVDGTPGKVPIMVEDKNGTDVLLMPSDYTIVRVWRTS